MIERTEVVAPVETLALHVSPNTLLRDALEKFYNDDFRHEVGNIALKSASRVPISYRGSTIVPTVTHDRTAESGDRELLSPAAVLVNANNHMFPFRNHRVLFVPYLGISKTNEDRTLRLSFAAMPHQGIRSALKELDYLPFESPHTDWTGRSIHMVIDIAAGKVVHDKMQMKHAYANLAQVMLEGQDVDVRKGSWSPVVVLKHVYGEDPTLRPSVDRAL